MNHREVRDLDRPGSSPPGARTAAAGALIVVLGVGWFALSHFVMGTAVANALGEALGVTLALLVVGSFVGAITSARRNPR